MRNLILTVVILLMAGNSFANSEPTNPATTKPRFIKPDHKVGLLSFPLKKTKSVSIKVAPVKKTIITPIINYILVDVSGGGGGNTPPRLNDTGITACGDYAFDGGSGNHNNNLNCNQTTDAGGDPIPAGQDGHYGRDVTHNDDSDGHAGFSFTKLDANGNTLPQSASSWSCVLDNVTKLIWEVKSATSGLQNNNNTYTWYNANPNTNGGSVGTQNGGSCTGSDCDTNAYVNAVNALNAGNGLCGANDWRLPAKEALRSIMDYSVTSQAIDANYFPNTVGFWYWSSSPYAGYSGGAWIVFFNYGGVDSNSTSSDFLVRLVRAGQ